MARRERDNIVRVVKNGNVKIRYHVLRRVGKIESAAGGTL